MWKEYNCILTCPALLNSQDHVEGVQLYTDLSCFTEPMSSQDHVEGVQLYTDLSCFTEPMSSQDHVEGVQLYILTCPALLNLCPAKIM